MGDERLIRGLEKLLREFNEVVIPAQGRYVPKQQG